MLLLPALVEWSMNLNALGSCCSCFERLLNKSLEVARQKSLYSDFYTGDFYTGLHLPFLLTGKLESVLASVSMLVITAQYLCPFQGAQIPVSLFSVWVNANVKKIMVITCKKSSN